VEEPARARRGFVAPSDQVRGQTPHVAVSAAAKRALAAFFAFGGFWGAWAAVVPAVRHAAGASNGKLGLALLFLGLGSLPAMLATGAALDRIGARVVPATLLTMAAIGALPSLARSVPQLAGAMLVVGAASGAADVAINAEVAGLEAATGRTLMPLAHALFSAGLIVGSVTAGGARQAGAGTTLLLACASAFVAVSAWANRRPYARVAHARPQRRIRRTLIAVGLVCALAFLIEGGIENWSALFLERTLGAQPFVSALAPAAYALSMVAGRLSGQRLLPRRRSSRVLTTGALIALAALVATSAAQHAALAIVGVAIAGAGVSLAAPILFGAAGRGASEADRGTSMATVTTLGYLGFLAGPAILGGTASAVGLRGSFVVLAGAAAVIAAAAPRLQLR
jgi:predicted MFS family arabinose efflux permease